MTTHVEEPPKESTCLRCEVLALELEIERFRSSLERGLRHQLVAYVFFNALLLAVALASASALG